MSATDGIVAEGDYAGAANDGAAVQVLIDMIPNPDAPHGTGAVQGTVGGYLDEMSPAAAAWLIAELTALKAAVSTTNTL